MTGDLPFYIELKSIAGPMSPEEAIRLLQAKADKLEITLVSVVNDHRVVCVPGRYYEITIQDWRAGNFN